MNRIQSKREQLAQRLAERIADRTYPPGSRMPSEQALMREHGVSRVTVRNALGDLAAHGLVERRRGRGGTVVTEDAAARLQRQHSEDRSALITVGIVLHPRMMRDAVIEKYFRLLIADMEDDVNFKVFFHDYLSAEEYQEAGCRLLIVEYGFPAEEVTACGKRLPVIVFARERGDHYVRDDTVGAGEMAVRYLAGKGHRRIACFPLDFYESVTHFEGERRAARALGVTLIPVRVSSMHAHDMNVRMDKLLSSGADFTAIIAPTDRDAFNIFKALKAAGKHVPRDVSIISYDNMFFSQYVETPLTTISHPYEKMAATIAQAIRDFVATGRVNIQASLPCSIVERQSVRALQEVPPDRK